jgi:ABC-type branched-subunit amino acid transport system substrate-binding protein
MRAARLPVGVALLVASLLGCGDPPGPSGDTIRVGLLAPFSGDLEALGKSMKNAAGLALSEINAAGGVLGRQLELLTEDTATDPVKAEAAARRLAESGVVALVGPAASSEALSVLPVIKAHALPMISASATSPALTAADDGGLFFRTVASDAKQGVVAANYAAKLGKKTAGVLYLDNAYGQGLASAFQAQFEKNGGVVKNAVPFKQMTDQEIEAYSFDAETKAVFKDQPELIFLISYYKAGAKITLQAKSLASYKPTIMGSDGSYGPDFLDNADPSVITGMVGTAPSPPAGDVNYKAFADRYQRQFGLKAEFYSENHYDAFYLIALAITASGAASREGVLGALGEVSGPPGTMLGVGASGWAELAKQAKTIDYEGASGAIDWDAAGDVTRAIYVIWEVVQGSGGKLETKVIETIELK